MELENRVTENQLTEFSRTLEKEKSIDISRAAKHLFCRTPDYNPNFGYEDVLVNERNDEGLLLGSGK